MNKQGGSTFVDENGRKVNFLQIAMMGAKEGKEVVETDDGFLIDGQLFERVNDGRISRRSAIGIDIDRETPSDSE